MRELEQFVLTELRWLGEMARHLTFTIGLAVIIVCAAWGFFSLAAFVHPRVRIYLRLRRRVREGENVIPIDSRRSRKRSGKRSA